MTMAYGQRRLILGAALVSTLAAAGWLAGEEAPPTEVVQAVRSKPAAAARTPQSNLPLDISALDNLKTRSAAERSVDDLFTAHSWAPPPVVREAPPPPPPPSAPPFPYTYIGKIIQDGVPTVYLARQENNFAVKVGDTLEGNYRVEQINGAAMTLLYLPLNMKQTFPIGEAN